MRVIRTDHEYNGELLCMWARLTVGPDSIATPHTVTFEAGRYIGTRNGARMPAIDGETLLAWVHRACSEFRDLPDSKQRERLTAEIDRLNQRYFSAVPGSSIRQVFEVLRDDLQRRRTEVQNRMPAAHPPAVLCHAVDVPHDHSVYWLAVSLILERVPFAQCGHTFYVRPEDAERTERLRNRLIPETSHNAGNSLSAPEV